MARHGPAGHDKSRQVKGAGLLALLILLALALAEAPPAGASYCYEVAPEDCPYPWTFWEGRWVYSPWKASMVSK
jgi:hypothetical protein